MKRWSNLVFSILFVLISMGTITFWSCNESTTPLISELSISSILVDGKPIDMSNTSTTIEVGSQPKVTLLFSASVLTGSFVTSDFVLTNTTTNQSVVITGNFYSQNTSLVLESTSPLASNAIYTLKISPNLKSDKNTSLVASQKNIALILKTAGTSEAPSPTSKPTLVNIKADTAFLAWSHDGNFGKNASGVSLQERDATISLLLSYNGTDFTAIPSNMQVSISSQSASVSGLESSKNYYFKVSIKTAQNESISPSSDKITLGTVIAKSVTLTKITNLPANNVLSADKTNTFGTDIIASGGASNAVTYSIVAPTSGLGALSTINAQGLFTPEPIPSTSSNTSYNVTIKATSLADNTKSVTYAFAVQKPIAPSTLSKTPDTPVFTAKLGTDPEKEIVLSWSNHKGFGKNDNGQDATPASVAYTVEISTDGQIFSALPSTSILINPSTLSSAVKEVVVSGLSLKTNYWFRVTALNTNPTNSSASYTSPKSMQTIAKSVIDASTQATYSREDQGGPARPTWIDGFRYYEEAEFFRKGRYILMWRKDPGDRNTPTKRFELYQILFKNPTEMASPTKFGAAIDPQDIASTTLLTTIPSPPVQTEGTYTFPNNLLPANQYSTVSSSASPAKTEYVASGVQVGYFPLNSDNNSRQLVVAYKVRVFADVSTTDDFGNPVTREVYNDGVILMINYRDGKFANAGSGSGTSGSGGGTTSDHVPDAITTIEQVKTKLKFGANQTFATSWEQRKITGTAPIEQLMTKADYDVLFPFAFQKAQIPHHHDQTHTYYTWENLVEASRYFPKFLNEGTKEDKYRELAAFLGNKSHETGDGWPDQGIDRYKMGLVWIVELTALSNAGISVKSQEDLYKAYFPSGYWNAGNVNYPPVPGKSYHGRGPVQLSWNYNYGQMSEALFGDKSILLENPDLLARFGIYGWASAIWFWMQPQSNKPSCHDVMIGNVDLSEPYTLPTSKAVAEASAVRKYTSSSKGYDVDGNPVDYTKLIATKGMEVGFGMTINIINGGLESGTLDDRQARRISYFAKYLDYFGKNKSGRMDGQNLPISPAIPNTNGVGGDPVDNTTVELFRNWSNWIYLDGLGKDPAKNFPMATMPNVVSSRYTSPTW